MLGVEVEAGDIVLSAGTATGRAKVGRVYGFNKNDWPMVEYPDRKYNTKTREYEPAWVKGSAGFHVLVVGRPRAGRMTMTAELTEAVTREYPSATTDLG